MKTKFCSYCINGVAEGCKYCVKGEKLVLFMGGKCSRHCWYCSLSNSRKKCKDVYANERKINSVKDLIDEAKESKSKGAGITGGDPLLNLNKTLLFCKKLKEKFGKHFHIHIYLPLNIVTKQKLQKLSKYVDEIRFHPSFLINSDKKLMIEEIEKIKTASLFFGKENTGIELPLIPEFKQKILDFIISVEKYIRFVNLNEFEISETNFNIIVKKYPLNKDTYTISGSKKAGLWLLQKLKKTKLKAHVCTAKTKDSYQYVNRMKKHNILCYGNRTNEGTVVYFAIYPKDLVSAAAEIRKITKNYYVDKSKKRILLDKKVLERINQKTDFKIARVEEPPTFNSEYLEFGWLN